MFAMVTHRGQRIQILCCLHHCTSFRVPIYSGLKCCCKNKWVLSEYDNHAIILVVLSLSQVRLWHRCKFGETFLNLPILNHYPFWMYPGMHDWNVQPNRMSPTFHISFVKTSSCLVKGFHLSMHHLDNFGQGFKKHESVPVAYINSWETNLNICCVL